MIDHKRVDKMREVIFDSNKNSIDKGKAITSSPLAALELIKWQQDLLKQLVGEETMFQKGEYETEMSRLYKQSAAQQQEISKLNKEIGRYANKVWRIAEVQQQAHRLSHDLINEMVKGETK